MKPDFAVGKALLRPPKWVMALFTLLTIAGLVLIFANGWEEHPLSGAFYALSAYTLAIVCIWLAGVLPGALRKARRQIHSSRLAGRYLTNAEMRFRFKLRLSLTIDLVYSALNLIIAFLSSSVWQGALAGYYMVLALMHFLLVRSVRISNDRRGLMDDYRRYRICGVLLLLLILTLSGIIFQMVRMNQGFAYPGILIYASAAYTFYTVIFSIADIIRHHDSDQPLPTAFKAIRVAAALVSLLALETAMLSAFGGGNEAFRMIMVSLTGAAVCLSVLCISITMIRRANREIHHLQKQHP